MSEEEKKAIQRLEYVNRQYDCNNYYSIYDLECIETVLNLIQKQQKEIELLKDQKQYVIDEYENTIDEKQLELKKKDKIIDEMAPQVYLNEQQREEMKKYINKLDNKPKDFTSFVKQYFEKKVEGK